MPAIPAGHGNAVPLRFRGLKSETGGQEPEDRDTV